MKAFKILLLLLVFTIVLAGAYAWTNIWLPKNTVGVLYLADDKEPKLIKKKKFDWHWQRILLKTTMLAIPTTTKIDETIVSFYLPNTEYYSGLLKVTPENFKSTTKIKILYHINPDTLTAYLTQYYDNTIPMNYESVVLALSEQIKTTIFSTIQAQSFDFFEENTSITYADWDSMLTTMIESSLSGSINQSYPVIVEKVLFETIEMPSIETYVYIDNNNPLEALNNENTTASNDALWLQQYIQFIKKLGDATKDNPHSVEIIKALTPAHVRESLQ